MFFERARAVLLKYCKTPFKGLWFKSLCIVPFAWMFHSALHSYYSVRHQDNFHLAHRLSHCYVYGERYNIVKDKLWMCVTAPQFSLTCPGMLLHYKADVSIGHISKNLCSLTNFVISLWWAVLDDVRASSHNMT